MKKNVLILGSEGQIGSALKDYLSKKFKVSPKNLILLKQTHSNKCHFILKRPSKKLIGDGLITTKKNLALGIDMIAPEGFGEIIGGGQREDNIEILEKSIRHHDLPLDPFKWFLDLRKYGSVPHSGFGLGLERVVAWICNVKHIRETIPFPRTMGRIEP